MALSHSPSIVTDGLVLCLDAANPKSYPGSGVTWGDLSGIGNNGSLFNTPSYSTQNGGSLVFDGVDDYVNSGNGSSIPSITNFTISLWFRWNGSGGSWQGLVTRGRDSGAGWYGLWINSSAIVFGGNTNLYSPTILSNTWYNAVGVRRNGVGKILYINSIQSASDGDVPSAPSDRDLVIGRALGVTEFFNGRIAQAQVYNRALSASEVLQNFNALRGRFNL